MPIKMDFNSEIKIVSSRKISEKDAYEQILDFESENNDLDGIYKIQINEVLDVLKKGIDYTAINDAHE